MKNDLHNEFTPYEQALAVKELGFDEPCFGCYFHNNENVVEYNPDGIPFNHNNSKTRISAPTFSQVFRFFREKYLLFGYPYPNDYQNYGYRIVEMTSDENKELVYDWGTKDTYEEAELECLKRIIEIIKEKRP